MKKKIAITTTIIGIIWILVISLLLILMPKKGSYSAEPLNEKEHMSIKLKGEVNFPGTYKVKPGEKLEKVIQYANGFTDSADKNTINLDYKISKNDREFTIPAKKRLEKKKKINLNLANEEDLLMVKGITKLRAKNIIKYRKTNGRFNKVEDLLKVKGIKGDAFNKIKDFFTV